MSYLKDRLFFAVPKQACLKNVDFILRVQDKDYEEGAVMEIWNIIIDYVHDDEVLYLKEASDKWIIMRFRKYETLRYFFLSCRCYISRISHKTAN